MFNLNTKAPLGLMQILLILSSIFSIYAQDTGTSNPGISGPLSVGAIIAGCVLIVIGLVFIFFGNKILKFIIFLAGAGLFVYLTYLSANAVIDIKTASDGQMIGIYVAMGVLGLMGGLLAVCVWQLGLILLGGCLGAAIGSLIVRTNVIPGSTGQIICIVVFAVVFAILTFVFSNVLVIIATAFYGAFVFMLGVDYFARVGFSNFIKNIDLEKQVAPSGAVWAMIASTVVIALIGMLVQFKTRSSSS